MLMITLIDKLFSMITASMLYALIYTVFNDHNAHNDIKDL